MKAALFIALAVFTAGFIFTWVTAILRRRSAAAENVAPDGRDAGIGFVTNFFDTLGIGSFATTSAFFKLWGLVPDERLPGTLNVGHTLPSILQAFIYIAVIQVDLKTLILMIAAACVGAWLGAGIVSHWPRRYIQIGMGGCLLAAAILLTLTLLGKVPGGGTLLGLEDGKLIAAVVANMVLGALMTLGIGLYAPCMMVVSMLGMNPTAAFPIMMGSCAFLMPVGSIRFIRTSGYTLKQALGLAIGGLPGVLIAAFLVKSLPLTAVRWLVVVVVLYTAAMLLRSAIVEARQPAAVPAT
jgi:uncharacterized membrane protein YfcA